MAGLFVMPGFIKKKVAPAQFESILYSTMKANTVYSTEEQEIGTWINGKKMYRRIYTGKLDDKSQTTSFPTGLNDSCEYVTIEKAMYYNGKGGCWPIPFCTYSDLKFAVAIYMSNNFGSIIIERGTGQLKTSSFYASVLYSK